MHAERFAGSFSTHHMVAQRSLQVVNVFLKVLAIAAAEHVRLLNPVLCK